MYAESSSSTNTSTDGTNTDISSVHTKQCNTHTQTLQKINYLVFEFRFIATVTK